MDPIKSLFLQLQLYCSSSQFPRISRLCIPGTNDNNSSAGRLRHTALNVCKAGRVGVNLHPGIRPSRLRPRSLIGPPYRFISGPFEWIPHIILGFPLLVLFHRLLILPYLLHSSHDAESHRDRSAPCGLCSHIQHISCANGNVQF